MTTLALKYRPRLLSDLVGQEASIRALGNLLKRARSSGQTPHQAFLFAGVRGTGKTSTARILARALNCVHGPTASPCGECDPCKAAENPDSSLDIVEIDAASRASVEDARALREQAQTRPAFCRYRIYIIDEVHMLSAQAFDALLKLLEEPPAHAIFVLATTELHDVPDTIKSRVQIYPFRLIPVGLIEQRLRVVCEREGVGFEEGSLRLVAEAGQGSMRDALTTLDRVIAAGDGVVLEEVVREQLGIVPAVRVLGVLESLIKGDTVGILDHCQQLASLGADWVSFWRELMQAFRDRLEVEVRKNPGPQELLRWSRMLHMLLQRERDLRDSSLPRVVVELALLTAAQLPHLLPLDALASGVAPAQPLQRPAPRPEPPVAVPAPRPEAPVSAAAPVARPGAPARPATAPSGPPAAPALVELEEPVAVAPGTAPPASSAEPIPLDSESLRKACSGALASSGSLRALAAIPMMALDVAWEAPVLSMRFPSSSKNTVQEFERERANPHLLAALGGVLAGLTEVRVAWVEAPAGRPEDQIRKDPAFQTLLQATRGEIVDLRKE
jgi:DNA polymerase-3 subunit gamma/tau